MYCISVPELLASFLMAHKLLQSAGIIGNTPSMLSLLLTAVVVVASTGRDDMQSLMEWLRNSKGEEVGDRCG